MAEDRIIRLTLLGYPIEPLSIAEDETGLIISEETRVAFLKLIENTSPNGLRDRGLSDAEANSIIRLYRMLET